MKFQRARQVLSPRSRNPLATRPQLTSPPAHSSPDKVPGTLDRKKALASLPGRCHLYAYQIFKDQHHRLDSRHKKSDVKQKMMPDEQESAAVFRLTEAHFWSPFVAPRTSQTPRRKLQVYEWCGNLSTGSKSAKNAPRGNPKRTEKVELDGLEPTTPALQTRCSPN